MTRRLQKLCWLGILLFPAAVFADTVRDEFNAISYAGNNGTANWTNSWQELGETNGTDSGRVRVLSNTRCAATNCLRIGGDEQSINGRGASRQADLTGALSATLTFSYRRQLLDGSGGSIDLDVWDDDLSIWVTLQTYQLNGSDGAQVPQSFDITDYIFANTQIRFIGSGSEVESYFYADNVEIDYDLLCPGGNVITTSDSVSGGSLRACVIWANGNAGADTITVPPGTYVLNRSSGDDVANNGDLDITDDVTIMGASESVTIVDGNDLDRIFHILGGANVTMSGITIRDGDSGGDAGGGIRVQDGSLRLSDATVTSNTTTKEGGGIYGSGSNANITLTRVTLNGNSAKQGGGVWIKDLAFATVFTDVTVSGNSATEFGGGIYQEAGDLTLNGVTASGNSAEIGGGLYQKKGTLQNYTNVTVSGNTATNEGGGMFLEQGAPSLTNVTVTGNSASASGGGIYVKSGPVYARNTIVANSPSGGNCAGVAITLLGGNLDEDGTCGFGLTGDPILGSLQDNGGLTLTHELLAGSPAIDTGTNSSCPATDQRGVARPIDGDGDATATCDIGAYEAPVAVGANLALTMTDSVDPVTVGGAFTYSLTATNNGPVDASNVIVVDTLPADVEWQSATPSQGSCVHSGEPLGGTVTCTLGAIANGANATIDIGVDSQGATGVVNNTATVSADEPDPDAADNTAAEDTTIIDPSANLRVTQAEDFDPTGINFPLVYTVTVANQGPAAASLVTLVDTLDAAVTYQTAVPSQGSCSETGGTVTCDLGDLANGSSATIDITVTAPGTPQTVTNTAVVSAAEPDSDPDDNTSSEDTDVIDPPPADLEMTIADTPDPVVAGNPLSYTLTINNLGPGPATVVQLTDTLPAGTTFVSATPSTGSCSETGGTVDCSFSGVIANGASENVDIVVTTPATAGPIINSASVSTAATDPNPTNDSASVDTTVTIVGDADLALSVSDSPDPVLVNQVLSYSLVVDNLGPDSATDVVLVDTLPPTVTFQSAVASQGSCSEAGGTVTCTLGMIANAANATVDILVTAPASAGSISNDASVSTSSTDSNAANDSASENTTVQNLNVNQVCYLVADAGGGGGGNDLLTRIDTADFDPLTNETNIGIGTGTNTIEAIAWNSATGVLYAANANRLGTLSTTTGVFTALSQSFGTGSGAFGNITFNDVDGLSYDATTGILYGSERQSGTDVLIQINMNTGAHVPNAFGNGIDYVPIIPISGNNITDDIAVDPTTGVMYASTNSGGSTDLLVIVNKNTGATSSVGIITVPDIEGLGTDASGQLWGTSGTQRYLYELNKATGEGTNRRRIDNGSDYESVDCFAFSPSVTADLGVTKTVDDAAPVESDTVVYTVTATNAGPGVATVVQLSDVLPAGVSFVSAVPSQGTYDRSTGAWFVGTLNAGNNATLNVQASVDLGTAGTTVTNTASVTFASQYDPNAGNNAGSADIIPEAGVANLTVLKSVVTVRDPLGAVTPAALAIPGAVMQYEISITNSGNGTATEVVVSDTLNANISFLAGEYNGGAADVQIIVGAAAPVFCTAEVDGDSNADGCFLNAAGDHLTVTIPVSATYPTGLTVGTTAPDNVAVVRFRVTVN